MTQALKQTLEAGCRWGYMTKNPAKLAGRNPQPQPRIWARQIKKSARGRVQDVGAVHLAASVSERGAYTELPPNYARTYAAVPPRRQPGRSSPGVSFRLR